MTFTVDRMGYYQLPSLLASLHACIIMQAREFEQLVYQAQLHIRAFG